MTGIYLQKAIFIILIENMLQAWMGMACDHLSHTFMWYANTHVVYCMPKTLYGVLSQLFLIHPFSTLLITLFTIFPW